MWLAKNNVRIQKDAADNRPETHLLLNGGKLHIDDGQNDEFLMVYAKGLFYDENMYVVEKKTPVFKLMAEFDLCLPLGTLISQEQLEEFITLLQTRVINVLYAKLRDDEKIIVISIPRPFYKIKKINGADTWDFGIHLHWPHIKVDRLTTHIIRQVALTVLEPFIKKIGSCTDIADVYDPNVYDKNGYRMPMSRKAEGCNCGEMVDRPDQKKKIRVHDKDCPKCGGCGYRDLERVYTPIMCYSIEGEPLPELFHGPTFMDDEHGPSTCIGMVRMLSIRLFGEQQITPFDAPNDPKLMEMAQYLCERCGRKDGKRPQTGTKGPQNPKKKAKKAEVYQDIPSTDKRYPIVYEFLKVNFKGEPGVIKLKTSEDGSRYYVNTQNKYCMNKGCEHTSATVYFLINRKGCMQKCFSTKEEIRIKGSRCCDFKSPNVAIPHGIMQELFPNYLAKRRARLDRDVRESAAMLCELSGTVVDDHNRPAVTNLPAADMPAPPPLPLDLWKKSSRFSAPKVSCKRLLNSIPKIKIPFISK